MAKAIWNNVVLAESNQVEVVEGNTYFPPQSVNRQYLRENAFQTECYWKGTASYYDIVVNDQINQNAAFVYPNPSPKAKHIRGFVGFWTRKDVRIED